MIGMSTDGSTSEAWRDLNVSVDVDGDTWERVQDLTQSGPGDRHYVLLESDQGTGVVEFGDGVHGQRPLADADIVVRYRDGAGQAGQVGLTPGRVILDIGSRGAAPTGAVLRARVVDNVDPLMQHRLRVVAPSLHGDEAVWAMACLPAGATDDVPALGETVWVALEHGNPDNLVWLGRVSAV